jgi:hypothetical protein
MEEPMAPYSMDLRTRVLADCDAGIVPEDASVDESNPAICRHFADSSGASRYAPWFAALNHFVLCAQISFAVIAGLMI